MISLHGKSAAFCKKDFLYISHNIIQQFTKNLIHFLLLFSNPLYRNSNTQLELDHRSEFTLGMISNEFSSTGMKRDVPGRFYIC